MKRLTATLEEQPVPIPSGFAEAAKLEKAIRAGLTTVDYEQ